MTTILSALFTPEVLAAILLTALGVIIFVMIRPKEPAPKEEFWLALTQPDPKSNRAEVGEKAKPGEVTSEDDIEPQQNKGIGLTGF